MMREEMTTDEIERMQSEICREESQSPKKLKVASVVTVKK